MSVGLTHYQVVLSTFKDLCLVNNIQAAPCEVPLSFDDNTGLPFPIISQSCGFLLICVLIRRKERLTLGMSPADP